MKHASNIKDDSIKGVFPSLYLNIAKCYEDLQDFANAQKNYQLALVATDTLADDGYGNMIKKGILSGIERISNTKNRVIESEPLNHANSPFKRLITFH